MENLIIIGSGPAGHTAAIYAARAKLNPLMFEGAFAAGVAAGGQLTTTTEVENFPGFLSIQGPVLMDQMRRQSLHCGARILTETVDKVDVSQRPFKVWAGAQEYQARALIIATGATAKRMNLPGEDRLWQKGISACAVCDGGLPFFRNKVLAVVGGGDSAVEESTYLTKFASKVLMLVRRDVLRASKVMQERAQNNPKIEIMFNTLPVEILGEKSVSGLKIKNAMTKAESTLDIGGLFYAIGHLPNTSFLGGQLALDEAGYIKTQPGTTQTNVEGVFAAGDVQDKRYRQAVTSAGTGCMAALEAEHFLSTHSH
ncbi:MAG: thioredoxin-disulfide reductase [Candidatus Omnitrophica bacterium]|nr:thioredoxin-disulfide reductase [Candidatus Omnitrophota bacterium]MDE2222577.1 thioredoxin-disulfide reductase [Candidatus Omnitrophota bacterium]